MKKNNKGFMLAEVIIVSAVLMGAMVSMYSGFNKLYINYRDKHKYYNIDALLCLDNIKTFLINELDLNDLVDQSISNTYVDILNYYENQESSDKKQYFTDLKDFYNISNLYIYDNENNLNNLINSLSNNDEFKSYLEYLKNSIDYNTNNSLEKNRYLIIEIENGDKKYFSYLAIGGSFYE